MDLFDILEKLFRGIVYFLYNVAGTMWAIISRPRTAPIQLYREYLRPKARQLGGMTFLFLALFIFNAVSLAILNAFNQPETIRVNRADSSSWFGSLTKALVEPPSFSSEALWPNLLASLISTVTIDAVLRLILRWRAPNRSGYRQMILAASEYSILWMIVAAMTMAALFSILTQLGVNEDIALLAVLGWGIVSLTSTSLPAARFLARARPVGTRMPRGGRWVGAWMVVLAGIFLVATFIGLEIGISVQFERDYEKSSSSNVRVRTLRCENLPDGRFDVDALLYVGRSAPKTFEETEFYVEFQSGGSPRTVALPLTWRGPRASPFLMVSEGQPVIAELRTKDPVKVSLDNECQVLVGSTFDSDPAPITGVGVPKPVDEPISM